MERDASGGAVAAAAGSALVLIGAPLAPVLGGVSEGAATAVFAAAIVVNLLAFMALGGPGRRGRAFLASLGFILAGGFALLLTLPPVDAEAPAFWLGLPPRAAVAIYGLGLLPILLVPLAYAWTFRDPRTDDSADGADSGTDSGGAGPRGAASGAPPSDGATSSDPPPSDAREPGP